MSLQVEIDIRLKVKKLLIQQAKAAVKQYQWSGRYEVPRDKFYEILPSEWPLQLRISSLKAGTTLH